MFWVRLIALSFGLAIALACGSITECGGFANCAEPIINCQEGPLPDDRMLYSWVQLSAKTDFFTLRAITQKDQCPYVRLGTKCQQMRLRAGATKNFDNSVCELEVQKSITSAFVGQNEHIIPVEGENKVLVVGNTGCNLKNCQSDWKFPKIAKSMQQKQASLIIHMGNIMKRGGSLKDSFQTFNEDFLKPASEAGLLKNNVFLFNRGEDEMCAGGAWNAWFRYLSPLSYTPANCDYVSQTYLVRYSNLDMLVYDSSGATDDKNLSEGVIKELDDEISQASLLLEGKELKKPILLTHRSVWVCEPKGTDATGGVCLLIGDNDRGATLRKTIKGTSLKDQLNVVITGDPKFFSLLSFKDKGPMQLVVGNGGGELSTPYSGISKPGSVGNDAREVLEYKVNSVHGYILLQPDKNKGSISLLAYNIQSENPFMRLVLYDTKRFQVAR